MSRLTGQVDSFLEPDFTGVTMVNSFPFDGLSSGKLPVYVWF